MLVSCVPVRTRPQACRVTQRCFIVCLRHLCGIDRHVVALTRDDCDTRLVGWNALRVLIRLFLLLFLSPPLPFLLYIPFRFPANAFLNSCLQHHLSFTLFCNFLKLRPSILILPPHSPTSLLVTLSPSLFDSSIRCSTLSSCLSHFLFSLFFFNILFIYLTSSLISSFS